MSQERIIEIKKDIEGLKKVANSTNPAVAQKFKDNAIAKIARLENELKELEKDSGQNEPTPDSGQNEPTPDSSPEPTPEPPPAPEPAPEPKTKVKAEPKPKTTKTPDETPNQVTGNLSAALLTAIQELMKTAPGSAVDSSQVSALIEQYLENEKVKLSQLDSSVLDEIRKNQTVRLELPQHNLSIEVNKSVAQIPNIYAIIDDVLSGNNVFLIGEAGGGKTYTAEKVAEILKRSFLIINCSQYTSPVEIIGGQTIEGYKDGKLIVAWRDGRLLILDEMPKLDSNTAGLFNDALAKSTKTRPGKFAQISTANPEEPPIPRADDFAVIATGNLYPNKPPVGGYVGNNQQDLSLLDRFSGSVYFVEFSDYIDQESCRYKLLYNFLVGNYHQYIDAVRNNRNPPEPVGLRTVIEKNGFKNMALMSYRTITAFRVAFEIELVRAIAKKAGHKVLEQGGKTVRQTYENYLVAFSLDARESIIRSVGTPEELESRVKVLIDQLSDGNGNVFKNELTPAVAEVAQAIYENAKGWTVAQNFNEQ